MPTLDFELVIAALAAILPVIVLAGLAYETILYLRHRRYDRERIARIIKRHS